MGHENMTIPYQASVAPGLGSKLKIESPQPSWSQPYGYRLLNLVSFFLSSKSGTSSGI